MPAGKWAARLAAAPRDLRVQARPRFHSGLTNFDRDLRVLIVIVLTLGGDSDTGPGRCQSLTLSCANVALLHLGHRFLPLGITLFYSQHEPIFEFFILYKLVALELVDIKTLIFI